MCWEGVTFLTELYCIFIYLFILHVWTLHSCIYVFSQLQNQAGFDQSKQASDEQSQTLDLAKHLTNEYKTQVAAHLTLQQLQDFSCDILRSILSMTSSMAENPNTVHLCVNAAGL